METKRQRKRINYARLSRVGHEEAKDENPQSTLPCTSCGRKLAHIPSFLMHLLHCSSESHECPQCPEIAQEQPTTTSEEAEDSKSTKPSFSCVEDLDKHVLEHHLNSNPFSCYVCYLNFPTLSKLQKHQIHDHKVRPNTRYEERKVDFHCSGCQEHFKSGNDLAKHFLAHPACAGNLTLWQCIDPETDAENDVLIRLRECGMVEEAFMTRFPSARLGLNLFQAADQRLLKPTQPQTTKGSPKKSAQTPVSKSAAPTPKPLMKPRSQTPKIKLFQKKKIGGQSEVAKAVAAVNKKKRGPGRPRKRTSPLNELQTEVMAGNVAVTMVEQNEREEVIESPKRRKLDDANLSAMNAEEETEDLISSPEAPFGIQGSSPGFEPEGEEDEEVAPQQPQSLDQICDMSDVGAPNDDTRVAHAVEVMACRACGITFDLIMDYTAHMRTIHDLELPSPTNRARGRPKKKTVNENDHSAAMMMEHAVDDVVNRVSKALYESHQGVHWTDDQTFKSVGKKRGRKPKRAEFTVFGESITKSPGASKGLLCPLCPDRPTFVSCDARESHLATLHDGERAFGCQVCGETFSLFYELQLHNRQEHDVGDGPPAIIEDPARAKLAYKCVVCKVGFLDETILQRHYDAMHTLDEGEQYHCPVCYFTYSGCRTRDDHVLKKHPEARAFKCPVCEARFASFEVFRAHEKRAHISQKTRLRSGMSGTVENAHVLLGLTEKPKKPRRKLAAAMRGALSEKSNDAVSAEAIAEKRRKSQMYKEGTLYCEKCNEDCANEEELDIHTKEHVRKEKRFGCTQCGRVFSGPLARSFLVDHIKLEHMHQSAYVCDDCDQRFYYKVQSDRHRTVDRDSGVASCKRVEDLNIPLPRLVFGCSRCAKIFAGDGAQSRYSEHQLECVSSPPGPAPEAGRDKEPPPPIPPPAPQSPLAKDMSPGILQVKQEENEVALAISEAVGVISNSIEENETENIIHQPSQEEEVKNDVGQGFAGDETSNVGLMVTDETVHSQQEDIDSCSQESSAPDTQQTVIVLPSVNPGDEGDEGQVVVLPEDVLSNVRAAGLGDDGGGSVVLIQAEDGTLIVASEEQLAELQMQENIGDRSVMRDMLQGGDAEVKDDGETMSG